MSWKKNIKITLRNLSSVKFAFLSLHSIDESKVPLLRQRGANFSPILDSTLNLDFLVYVIAKRLHYLNNSRVEKGRFALNVFNDLILQLIYRQCDVHMT